jgi:hypothetical protein
MAHDGSDGSQYDIKGPWDQDRLLLKLEEALAAVDAAETLTEKSDLRAIAAGYGHDLFILHGIDLGPF